MKTYYTYILASERNGTLYIGVTNNIARRAFEHKECIKKGFTEKYKVDLLVYYESYQDIYEAIKRENN